VNATRRAAVLATAFALCALAACGDDDGGSSAEPDVDGTEWVSSEVTGHELVAGTEIRLTFQNGRVSANAGCNTMGGEYTFDGSTMSVAAMEMTDMGCEEQLAAQDEFLATQLGSGPTVEVDGDLLTLTSGEATMTMIDSEVAEPDLPWEGPTWQLDGIVEREAVSSVPQGVEASLVIADGMATVDTGCNSGTTTVEVGDDTLTFSPMAVTLMLCEDDANAVQDAVLRTLDGEVSYEIDADRLSIRRDDDSGLDYTSTG
jgi:heat shock protein HslJ